MLDILFQIQFEQETYSADKGWFPIFEAIQQKIQDETFSAIDFSEFSESVRDFIQSNYVQGNSFTGEPVAALKQSTIDRKGHSIPFFHTGELWGSILLGNIPSGYEVFVRDSRSKIAAYLQEDDSRGADRRVGRPAFGITDGKVDSLLNYIINRNN